MSDGPHIYEPKDTLSARISELEAENARLRKALNKLVIHEIARRALEAKDD